MLGSALSRLTAERDAGLRAHDDGSSEQIAKLEAMVASQRRTLEGLRREAATARADGALVGEASAAASALAGRLAPRAAVPPPDATQLQAELSAAREQMGLAQLHYQSDCVSMAMQLDVLRKRLDAAERERERAREEASAARVEATAARREHCARGAERPNGGGAAASAADSVIIDVPPPVCSSAAASGAMHWPARGRLSVLSYLLSYLNSKLYSGHSKLIDV